MVIIKIKRTPGNEDINMPKCQTPGSAAVDLHAAVKEKTVIKPGERKLIPTGFCMQFPVGFVAEITPRSGLALKNGISIVNSPGIIDSDYRDEVGVILINLGKEDFIINRNDRIAQMSIKKVEKADFKEVEELSSSERKGGFGSTGK
jgi:dUTP pyrophosphatase